MLGWSQEELARRAGLSRSAVARLELEGAATRPDTVEAISRALTAAGVAFLDGAEGVQLRAPTGAPRRT